MERKNIIKKKEKQRKCNERNTYLPRILKDENSSLVQKSIGSFHHFCSLQFGTSCPFSFLSCLVWHFLVSAPKLQKYVSSIIPLYIPSDLVWCFLSFLQQSFLPQISERQVSHQLSNLPTAIFPSSNFREIVSCDFLHLILTAVSLAAIHVSGINCMYPLTHWSALAYDVKGGCGGYETLNIQMECRMNLCSQ